MIRISDRAKNLKPSATIALGAKARALRAEGKDVLALSLGEPDWATFPRIVKAGVDAITEGRTRYGSPSGEPELKEFLADQFTKHHGVECVPEQVSVTSGAKMSLYAALQCLCQEGDEVVIPAPYWVSYPSLVELAGAKPVLVSCGLEAEYKMSPEQLEQSITPRTRAVFLNSPSNPTGQVYSSLELSGLAEVLRRHPDVVLISDDIYNELYFEGGQRAPHILDESPDLWSRTLAVNGASKSFSMTGWRVGWAFGPKELIQAMNKLQSQSVSCAAPFSQWASLCGLKDCQEDVARATKELKSKKEFAMSRLKALQGVECLAPQGAFYLWPSIEKILGKKFEGRLIDSDMSFAEALLESENLVLVPGTEFGGPGHLRLSFVLTEDRMAEAFRRLENFLGRLQ